MRKISVCTVVINLDVGGLEKVAVSLLNGLDRARFDPSLICLDAPGKLFDQVDLPPGRKLVLRRRPRLNLGFARVDPELPLAIRGFLRDVRADVLHVHNFAPLIFGGVSSRLLLPRPRVVYSEHNEINSASPRSLRKFTYYVRLADAIIAVSGDLATKLRRDLGVRRPVHVIRNGIDGARVRAGRRERLRAELRLPEDARVLGTVAVLSRQKGIDVLLDAAGEVLGRDPRAHVVIAGDGPARADLEARRAGMAARERVHFLGLRSDVPDVMAGLDAYVLSSRWEGLPLAVLEAMAAGKPIVATRVGGVPEAIEDGAGGYLVAPEAPRALADRLLALLSDPAAAAAMGARNAQAFDARFSLGAMLAAHERLFTEIAPAR
ncbi:glycosyltransferase [Sorangium sp. So ce542]|uniref:glycosyltransferase n=1 Tax=Sorangium sp. So ce542 TaxID=3133316 RepID=UPI003F6471D6